MRLPDALTRPNAENTFCSCPAAQTWNDLAIWEEFLNRHPIASLVELGTWKGGMAAFLAAQCLARGARFTTIDHALGQMENREMVERLGGTCLGMDVFHLEPMQALLLSQPAPRLLFCDNGNKRRELSEIAPCLEFKDYVVVHDWGSESGPGDIPPHWEPVLQEECEQMVSLTRFFQIPKSV